MERTKDKPDDTDGDVGMELEMEMEQQHQGFMMLRFRGISNERTWQQQLKTGCN